MENKKFINIREQQERASNGLDSTAFFGRSDIFFENSLSSKGSMESARVLNACVRAGILKPDTFIGQRAIRHDNGLSFVELSVGEEQNTFNTSAKVVSNSSGKFLETGSLDHLTDAQKITIISGLCLFSAPTALARLEDGAAVELCNPGQLDGSSQKVVDISTDDRLQAYEADSILRLTKVMSAVNSEDREVEVALNIPRVEYYFYILEAYEKGILSPYLAGKWFGLVDARAKRMEEMVKKRIPENFRVRGVNPLNCVENKVKKLVEKGESDVLRKIVSNLRNKNLFWRFAIENGQPENFSDISHLSYVLANLAVTQDGTTLPIAIENPEETPIVRNLKKALGDIELTMVLLYPHSNAVPKDEPNSGKFNNYFVDTPSHLENLKQIVTLNRQQ